MTTTLSPASASEPSTTSNAWPALPESETVEATPLQRLEKSRARISHFLQAQETARAEREAMSPFERMSRTAADLLGDSGPTASPLVNTARNAVNGWWHGHPLRPLTSVAQDIGESQIRRHPFLTVGGAFAVGAALAVLRPWRSKGLARVVLGSALVSQAKNVATQAVVQQIRQLVGQVLRSSADGSKFSQNSAPASKQ